MRHLIKQVCRLNDFAALRLSQFYAELRAYLIAVGCAAKGSFFNYVDQISPIIDNLPYPRLPLAKEFIYSYKGKLLLTFPVPLTYLVLSM